MRKIFFALFFMALMAGTVFAAGEKLTIKVDCVAEKVMTIEGAAAFGDRSTADGTVYFLNASNARVITIQSGATSADYTLTLPTAQASGVQYLKNDGAGVLSWDTSGTVTAWDDIGNPDANKAIDFASYYTSFTCADVDHNMFEFFGTGAFGDYCIMNIEQKTGDPTDGTVLQLRAADANVDVLRAGDGTNEVFISSGGAVTFAGTATITLPADVVTVAMMADGTDGELITWDADGEAAVVAAGTAGQVLTSNGAGAAPTFQAASATAYDDIGDPDASGSIGFGAHTGTYTSDNATWGGVIISNTAADAGATTLLSLSMTEDAEAAGIFLSMMDNVSDVKFKFGADAKLYFENAETISNGTDGVLSMGGDVAIDSTKKLIFNEGDSDSYISQETDDNGKLQFYRNNVLYMEFE